MWTTAGLAALAATAWLWLAYRKDTNSTHDSLKATSDRARDGAPRTRIAQKSTPTTANVVTTPPTLVPIAPADHIVSTPILAEAPPDEATLQRDAQLYLRRRLPQFIANEAALCVADRDDVADLRGAISIRFQLTSQADAARLGALVISESTLREDLTQCIAGRLGRAEFPHRNLGVFTDDAVTLTYTADDLLQKAQVWMSNRD